MGSGFECGVTPTGRPRLFEEVEKAHTTNWSTDRPNSRLEYLLN